MKLSQIINSRDALIELRQVKFKADKAFELKGFYASVDEELKKFEEVRVEKIKEYGEEGENGNFSIPQDSENLPKFKAEMNELSEKDVAIDLPVITVADLKDADVSVELLTKLDWLIK